jgi:LysM repeat protein
MAHSSSARWLAPLALVAACLALVVVLTTGGSSDSGSAQEQIPPAPAGTTAKAPARSTTTAAQPALSSATYTVQSGDFLSTVAEKTGVNVDRLRQLNPGLDANAMHVGQQIRLK